MYRAVVALASAAAAVTLAACSGSGGNSDDGNQDQASKNPVQILRKIDGCVIPASVKVGDEVLGVRYASCQIPSDDGGTDGDQITVYASSDEQALLDEQRTQGTSSSDSTKLILGSGFFLTDTGSISVDGGTTFARDPMAVAQDVGGTLA